MTFARVHTWCLVHFCESYGYYYRLMVFSWVRLIVVVPVPESVVILFRIGSIHLIFGLNFFSSQATTGIPRYRCSSSRFRVYFLKPRVVFWLKVI